MPSGYTTALPTNIALDVGVLYYDVGSTPTVFGVTEGGITVSPDDGWEPVEFDGRRGWIEGLVRPLNNDCVIQGDFIQISDAMLANDILLPGGATPVTAGTPATVTYTPVARTALLAAGQYLQNLMYDLKRGDGSTVRYLLARALVTKYVVTSRDKTTTKINAEFHAVLGASAAATSTDAAAYAIKTIAAS